jgi:hypothetical protein
MGFVYRYIELCTVTVQLSVWTADVYGGNRAWWVIGATDSSTAKWEKLLFYTWRGSKEWQYSDCTGALHSFYEVAAVHIVILLYWRQLPQIPACLWGLAVVPVALVQQVNDPAVSYGRTEEFFTQNNKSETVNLLLSRRKRTKQSAHKLSQPDTISTHQQTEVCCNTCCQKVSNVTFTLH